MTRIEYIYHSCFAVVGETCLIVYDYWRDPSGRLHELLGECDDKPVYFIVSHFHEDHFSPEVVVQCQRHPQWHLLPSYDTVRRRHIDKALPLAVLRFGEEVVTPHFRLKVYRSTDVGVSTVVELPDDVEGRMLTLYHAGDNNNWYFPERQRHEDASRVKVSREEMEKLFLSILRDIRRDYPHLDHAFFPVDPRLGQEMLRGPKQLLKTIDVGHLHPMHYALWLSEGVPAVAQQRQQMGSDVGTQQSDSQQDNGV